MKYLILLNILKLIHKFVPIKILEKNKYFFSSQAKRIVTKLSEARKKSTSNQNKKYFFNIRN